MLMMMELKLLLRHLESHSIVWWTSQEVITFSLLIARSHVKCVIFIADTHNENFYAPVSAQKFTFYLLSHESSETVINVTHFLPHHDFISFRFIEEVVERNLSGCQIFSVFYGQYNDNRCELIAPCRTLQ